MDPLARGEVTLGSLYDPSVGMKAMDVANQCFVADSNVICGSLPAKLQRPILYHVPSRVQHVGQISVWGGEFHYTRDFHPRRRARELRATA